MCPVELASGLSVGRCNLRLRATGRVEGFIMSRKFAERWLAAVVSLGALFALQGTGSNGRGFVPGAFAAEPGSGDKFGGKLQMQVDRNKVDLERHRLEVTLNRPVSRIDLKVLGENKEVLAEETFHPKESPGEPILLRWSQSGSAAIARIELYGHDVDDNWVGVAIVPWSVKIPHEDVHFDTDKATILPSEVGKLKDSLERIRAALQRYKELGRIQLFIAGHTDTVGAPAYNMDLSRRRAQAIAAWFLKSGLTIPVAYEGFGETALLVETKDEVDEPRNRRADYILAVEPPSLKKGRNPQWKYLNKASK
jgi:outer membrane protein OmpA-like peptidoglycan-associated protein